MIKLSKRLDVISSLVPINSKVVDIGCDHALLDIYLYQNKISNRIIATDINENALANAKKNIKESKLDKYIDTRLGNGLDIINNTDLVDTIIISGMGAHTIVGILKNGLDKLKSVNTIIIQSNTKLEFLRREVTKLHYMIVDEIIIEDNKKIYTIIKFVKGNKRYNRKELYFGPVLLKKNNIMFKKYVKNEYDKLNVLLKLLPKGNIMDRYKIKKEIRLYQGIVD